MTKFFIPERFAYYMPVWTVFYLAWLIPPEYGIAQMLGQIIHWYVNPKPCKPSRTLSSSVSQIWPMELLSKAAVLNSPTFCKLPNPTNPNPRYMCALPSIPPRPGMRATDAALTAHGHTSVRAHNTHTHTHPVHTRARTHTHTRLYGNRGWKWAKPEQCEMYTYSVAAGLIAGGSIATIVTAVFNVIPVPNLGM